MSLSNTDPFFLPGGSTGCLLIHGFSGSPAEMRGLGDYLHAQGHTVLGVCLAGHGYTPEALRATGWRDWLASAEAGFNDLRRRCATLVVIGFSFGGSLGILLSKRRSFEGLVLLATPLRLQGDWRLNILPLARYFVPWYYPLEQVDFSDPSVQAYIREQNPDVNLEDPAVQQYLRHSVKISVSAINELCKALHHTRTALKHVGIPTLVMHGCRDETVAPETAEEIVSSINSPHKQLVWCERTGHQMLVTGPERLAIYERIATFVAHRLC